MLAESGGIISGCLPHEKYQESALRSQMKDQTLLLGCLSGFPCQAVGEEVGSWWEPGWWWGIQGRGAIGTLSALGRQDGEAL